ncbi:MAG: hypothetical protein Q9167_007418, partial [Letrouitia subvulpina]
MEDTPKGRHGHCIAGIVSQSQTFEIFFYGGEAGSGASATAYDEIFILTLPSFHWIQVDYKAQNPRFTHTCNTIGGSQILISGGGDPTSPENGGDVNGMEPIRADPFQQGLA